MSDSEVCTTVDGLIKRIKEKDGKIMGKLLETNSCGQFREVKEIEAQSDKIIIHGDLEVRGKVSGETVDPRDKMVGVAYDSKTSDGTARLFVLAKDEFNPNLVLVNQFIGNEYKGTACYPLETIRMATKVGMRNPLWVGGIEKSKERKANAVCIDCGKVATNIDRYDSYREEEYDFCDDCFKPVEIRNSRKRSNEAMMNEDWRTRVAVTKLVEKDKLKEAKKLNWGKIAWNGFLAMLCGAGLSIAGIQLFHILG